MSEVTERRVHGSKKVSLQLSSKLSIGDVGIAQLDWYRVPQTRSSGFKSSVDIAIFIIKSYRNST